MTPEAIRRAFVAACEDELAALKPGNVHVHAEGHGMTVAEFRTSAAVASWPLCRAGTGLGARVLGAVEATRAAVGQNTNLGILLLCAPLALAAERAGAGEAPGEALRRALDGAGANDAAAVFHAIVLAAPGGLGEAGEHDVRVPPRVKLDVAMRAAAERDSIARQWSEGFADILGTTASGTRQAMGLAAHEEALAGGLGSEAATQLVFLRFLAALPDSHVARRHGTALAEAVRQEAEGALARFEAGSAEAQKWLLGWDASLKRRGINPGTTADLTVATLFASRIGHGLRREGDDGSVRRMSGPAGRACQQWRAPMAKITQVMVGESLVGEGNEVAHVDLLIGPRGSAAEQAFCNALCNNKDGFTTLLAVVAPNLLCKPNTILFNKVTIKGAKQAVQMFGPAQHAVAQAVADSVAEGIIPADEADDLFICVGVFIHWDASDDQKIQDYNYTAVKESIQRAIAGEPKASQVAEKAKTMKHPFAAAN